MIDQIPGEMTPFENPQCLDALQTYPTALKDIFDIEQVEQTVADIQAWPGYNETPLHSLEPIAQHTHLDKIWYKDESSRFGLGSFKALGGAYAVAKQIQNALCNASGQAPNMADLLSGRYKDRVSKITVSCATDGNHGRSVAWGAQLFGCHCVIYIHKHVSKGRQQAIENLGAQVIRVDGNYDDSVKQAAKDAARHQRIIVSDTSYPGYMDIPKDVGMGYAVMFDEIDRQLEGEIPSHIFIQGGVGGLAAIACAYAWQKWQQQRPTFIVVEPVNANCLQQSAQKKQPVVVEGELDTLMAGLACGEVSLLAWDILSIGTDFFVTITEDSVAPTMRLLASMGIEAGESAVAGLAAVMKASNQHLLGLNEHSKVLVIGTEGATDPFLYEQLTGIKR